MNIGVEFTGSEIGPRAPGPVWDPGMGFLGPILPPCVVACDESACDGRTKPANFPVKIGHLALAGADTPLLAWAGPVKAVTGRIITSHGIGGSNTNQRIHFCVLNWSGANFG